MSAQRAEGPPRVDEKRYRHLLAAVDDLPEDVAYGVEIDEAGLHLLTSPVNRHQLVVLRLQNQLGRQLPDGTSAAAGPEIDWPERGRLRRPDLVVIEERALETGRYLSPDDVHLVVEVVSASNPENDYVKKMAEYPAMGIPHYLIIDPRDGTGLIASNPVATPHGLQYRDTAKYTFGDRITVSGCTVDTSVFLPYEEGEA